MGLGDILQHHNVMSQELDRTRDGIREAEERLEELYKSAGFVQSVVRPLAEALLPELPADRFEVYGPFGLGAETSLEFFRGDESVGYLTVEPWGTERGVLSYDTGARKSDFARGTIGSMNGGNNVMAPLPESFAEIAAIARSQRELEG